MNSPRNRLIYLAQSPLATRALLQKVIKLDPTCSKIFHHSTNELVNTYQLPVRRAEKLYRYIKQYQEDCSVSKKLADFKIWTILDQDFPLLLKLIPDPPVILYGLGRSDYLQHSPSLAVVGTRHPSQLAKQHMYRLLKPLVDREWLFVSGMAYGIDGYAHRIADYYKGRTIAVLAGGLLHPYPSKHLDLFHRLAKNHLVISEYPPHLKPERYHFPERNRLISGLSFATLVVEAQERSGSLITADQALEQGREVMAVPGAISLAQAKGCHHLIQNGAKLIQNTYDILQEWELIKRNWRQIRSEIH
ncbi:DNA-processing protein DprA [Amphibacillus sp. Q70]|uniref:DNA-processing protein DprA n=1 Tax=Amphibacillus sp. Q70 TaxID=3453416 RepID=UPI003F85A417